MSPVASHTPDLAKYGPPTAPKTSPLPLPEPDPAPLQGSIIAFSLSLAPIAETYDHPSVRGAIAQFKPKKYLGVVHGLVHQNVAGYELEMISLFPVAARLAVASCLSRTEASDEVEWHKAAYVALGEGFKGGENGREAVAVDPPLPWEDCLVYTTHKIMAQVDRLYAADDFYRIATPRQFRDLVEYSEKDQESNKTARKAREAKRHAAEKNGKKTEEEENELGRYKLGLRIVLNIWEDISDIDQVPYPGEFEDELRQLQSVVESAYMLVPMRKENGEVMILSRWRDLPADTDEMVKEAPEPEILVGRLLEGLTV